MSLKEPKVEKIFFILTQFLGLAESKEEAREEQKRQKMSNKVLLKLLSSLNVNRKRGSLKCAKKQEKKRRHFHFVFEKKWSLNEPRKRWKKKNKKWSEMESQFGRIRQVFIWSKGACILEILQTISYKPRIIIVISQASVHYSSTFLSYQITFHYHHSNYFLF